MSLNLSFRKYLGNARQRRCSRFLLDLDLSSVWPFLTVNVSVKHLGHNLVNVSGGVLWPLSNLFMFLLVAA